MTSGKRNPKTSKLRTDAKSVGGPALSTKNSRNGRTHSIQAGNRRSPNSSILISKLCPSLLEFDKAHNGSVPCCLGLREIVQKIFPDFDNSLEAMANQGMDDDATGCSASKPLSSDPVPLQYSVPKTSRNDSKGASGHGSTLTLFHLLVRNHLLEDRWKKRQKLMPSPRTGDDDSKGDKNNVSHDEVDDDHPVLDPYLDLILERSNLKEYEQGQRRRRRCRPSEQESDTSVSCFVPMDPLPPHRTMESFFHYIQVCCNTVEKMSHIRAVGHGHRKRGGRHGGNVNVHEKMHSSSSVMPRIPLNEVMEVVQKITCRKCRGECSEYLKDMSSIKWNDNGNTGTSMDHHGHMPCARTKGGLFVAMGMQEDEGEDTIPSHKEEDGMDGHMNVIASIPLDKYTIQKETYEKHGISCDVSMNRYDQDVECAFDYNLMEEGGAKTQDKKGTVEGDLWNPQHGSNDGPDSKKRGGIWFDVVQEQGSSTKYFEIKRACGDDVGLTVEDFECWVKEVVIPCGMKEMMVPTGTSEEDVQLLSSRIDDSLDDFLNILKCRMPQVLSESYKSLAEAEDSLKTPGAFNVKAGKALKECTVHQDTFMSYCRELLEKLDQHTLHLRRYQHPYTQWSNQIVNELWDKYMSLSSSLIDPSLRFLWEGIQLDVKRTGSVPMQFNSPQQRQNLKEMLKKRLIAFSRLQDDLEVQLLAIQPQGNKSSTNLRKLVVLGHFFSLHSPNNSEAKDIKDSIRLMLDSRDNLIFEVVYQTNVSTILNMQDTRCDKLYDQICHSYGLVSTKLQKLDVDHKERLTWQTNSILIEEKQIEYDLLREQKAEPSLDRDVNRVEILCELAHSVLHQYRLIQQFQVSGVSEVSRIPKTVMRMCLGNLLSDECEYGYGKRRLVAILSACVFSWLEKKCIEWHAELMHQELMIETENEILREKINTDEMKKKSNKKKKKRKNANSNATASQETDIKSCDKQSGKYLEDQSKSPSLTVTAKNRDMVSQSESDTYQNVNETNDIEENEINLNTTMGFLSISKSDRDTFRKVCDTEKESKAQHPAFNEQNVHICVIDKGELVSAENFLCARYFQVLKGSQGKY